MRRLLMFVFSMLLLFSCITPLWAGAAGLTTEQKFDMLKKKGIFTGFADGSSRLNDPMSREQFATVIYRLWELSEESAKPSYSDVLKTRWSFGEIQAVTKAGLMKGSGSGKFNPTTNVTVEQLSAVLVRAYGASGSASAQVHGKVTPWAKKDVGIALNKHWIVKQSDYTASARRAQLVEAAYAVYIDMNPDQNPERRLDVQSIEAVSSNSIQVVLRHSVDSVVKEQFKLKDNEGRTVRIQQISLNGDRNKLMLITDKQTANSVYKLTVDGITWAYLTLSDDRTKPRITSSKINADATIEVVFSEPVDPGVAKNSSNYQFSHSLQITNIGISSDNKKVTITTGKQTIGTVYTLTVKNIIDLSRNIMDPRSDLYFGAVVDNTPPKITKISAEMNKVVLTLSEKMDPSFVGNTAFYSFDGGLGFPLKAVYNDSNLTVTLTTADQILGKVYTVTVNVIRDKSGNMIASNTQLSFAGVGKTTESPITLQNINVVNENVLDVYFNRSLAGTNISDLKIIIVSDNGSSVSMSGWGTFVQRKSGDERAVTIQFRISGNSNPALFSQGHVYVAEVTGILGLNTTGDANEKRFAGTNVPNKEPFVTQVVPMNNTAVTVLFSEPVKNVSAAAFQLTDSDGKVVPIVSDQLNDRGKIVTQVVVNLGAKLQAGKVYRMSFNGGITDAAGWNGLQTREGSDAYRVSFSGISTENTVPRIQYVSALDRYTFEIKFTEMVANADQNVYTLYNETDRVAVNITKSSHANYIVSADRQKVTVNLFAGTTGPLRSGKTYKLTYNNEDGNITDLQGIRLDTSSGGAEARFSGTDSDNARPFITSVEAWSTFILVTFSEEVTGYSGQTDYFDIRMNGSTIRPNSGSVQGNVVTLYIPRTSSGTIGSIKVSSKGAEFLRDNNKQNPLTDTVNFGIK